MATVNCHRKPDRICPSDMGRGKESVSSLLVFSSSKEKSATGYVGLGSRQIRTCTASTSGFRTIAWNIRAFEGQVFMTEQTLFLIATYDSIICVIIEGPSLGCSSCLKHFDGQLHQMLVTAVAQMSEISDVTLSCGRGALTGVFVCVCVWGGPVYEMSPASHYSCSLHC